MHTCELFCFLPLSSTLPRENKIFDFCLTLKAHQQMNINQMQCQCILIFNLSQSTNINTYDYDKIILKEYKKYKEIKMFKFLAYKFFFIDYFYSFVK